MGVERASEQLGVRLAPNPLDAAPCPSGDAMTDGDWNDTITLALVGLLIGCVAWGVYGGHFG